MSSTHTVHIIRCQYTGVQLATVQLDSAALAACSSQHWRMAWSNTVAEHPYFSLTPLHCLRSARVVFREILKRDVIRLQLDEPELATAAQVAFVAILRNMGVVLRNEGRNKNLPYILPKVPTVYTHCQHLLGLAYWYAQAQSPKFNFPKLNIARINSNTELADIGAYLTICQQQKDMWLEAEQQRAVAAVMDEPLADGAYANAAIRANRSANLVAAGFRKHASRQTLWNWLMAAIQAESASAYAKFATQDKAYFQEMFFAPKSKWKNYTLDEVESLEDVLLRFGPLGSVAFGAFRAELTAMQTHIKQQAAAFRIDWSAFAVTETGTQPVSTTVAVNAVGEVRRTAADATALAAQRVLAGMPEPEERNYPTRAAWLSARARWTLARIQVAEAEKQAARNQII